MYVNIFTIKNNINSDTWKHLVPHLNPKFYPDLSCVINAVLLYQYIGDMYYGNKKLWKYQGCRVILSCKVFT